MVTRNGARALLPPRLTVALRKARSGKVSVISGAGNEAMGMSGGNLVKDPCTARRIEVSELDSGGLIGPGIPANVSLSAEVRCGGECADGQTADECYCAQPQRLSGLDSEAASSKIQRVHACRVPFRTRPCPVERINSGAAVTMGTGSESQASIFSRPIG